MSQVDWTTLFNVTNVNVANTEFEDKFREILDYEAPMAIIQQRTWYQNWLTDKSKEEMMERDRRREVARVTSLCMEGQ